jgi:hypothetical protein
MTHPPRWTQPELEHLESLAGDVPFPTLLRSMHYMATAEGWPPRTDKAIVMRRRRLARTMPRVLGGFSSDALFALLEDRDLADAVAAAHPRPMGDWRVRCVETGQIWPSCGAAARELHVTQAAVSLAIRQGRQLTALGMTFEALRGAGPCIEKPRG